MSFDLDLYLIRKCRSCLVFPLSVYEYISRGALCVSYSGQCYLSAALSGRSANRGECAQYCRLPYSLIDADGKDVYKRQCWD